MTRQEKVIWAAGFIDGEGSISIGLHQKRHQLFLSATQVKIEPLLELKELWGGLVGIHRKAIGNQRTVYIWQVVTKRAAQACLEMLPYLHVKHAEAELAIQFSKLIRVHGSRVNRGFQDNERLTKVEIAEREAMRQVLKQLHHELEPTILQSKLRLAKKTPQLRMLL